ncbi:ankyrin repeat family protein [Collybia nuda]|uniref:Ankyrin repeat family protein n=1 Tax=Collybia nuda TaxID=64659 RepID=A0A9P5XS99_9AGAR|nr:ankyrin repeat family protein [Collybia nuda]
MSTLAPLLPGLVAETTNIPDDEIPGTLETVIMEAIHPELGGVAKVTAVKVFRSRCINDFLGIMDGHSDELHMFSVSLFNKHIQPQSWLLDGGRRSGTGCWGDEMNRGDIVYILSLEVQPSHRRQGLGTWVLQKLLSSSNVKYDDIVYCWPTAERSALTPEARKVDVNGQLAFYQKNGFRRVGKTDFIGYSPKPSHKSRLVPESSDATPISGDSALEGQVELLPLHKSIVELNTPEIEGIIQTSYDTDPSSIHRVDAYGFTPVHLALADLNIHALRKLIALGVTEDLRNSDNTKCLTPLEMLLETMRSNREFSETVLGSWNGYGKPELLAEFCVKRALGEIEDTVPEATFESKRKWGCTCGACFGGYMSPRMCYRLKHQGALIMDMMEQNMYMFKRGKPLEDMDGLFDISTDYLPWGLRSSMYKTFYKGYQTLFATIYAISGSVNTPATVTSLASLVAGNPDVSCYLSKGGRYEYALDAVTSVAREQSCLGDGTFDEMYEDEAEVGTEFTGLLKCANDLEFELVRRLIGLDPEERWGPYYDMDDDDSDVD